MSTTAFALVPSAFNGRKSLRAASASVTARPIPITSPRRTAAPISMKVYDVEILFQEKKYIIPIDENQTILDGIERQGLEVPYSCRAGVSPAIVSAL
jgi:ferredoxin